MRRVFLLLPYLYDPLFFDTVFFRIFVLAIVKKHDDNLFG